MQIKKKPSLAKLKVGLYANIHLFDYGIDTVSLPYSSDTERKGKEGKGRERISCPIESDDKEIVDLIWIKSSQKGRERSSRKSLAQEWSKIPKGERPTREVIDAALDAWRLSEKWQTGYGEGIHRWVKERQWENLPEPMRGKHSLNPKENEIEIPDL